MLQVDVYNIQLGSAAFLKVLGILVFSVKCNPQYQYYFIIQFAWVDKCICQWTRSECLMSCTVCLMNAGLLITGHRVESQFLRS